MAVKHLDSRKREACSMCWKQKYIFKSKSEASSRHHETAAKKPYSASLTVSIFHFNPSIIIYFPSILLLH